MIGAAVGLAVLTAAVACTGGGSADRATPTTARAADTREIEELLVTTQRQATPDLEIRGATCPARVEVTRGTTFQCSVVIENIVVPYEVALVDVDTPSRTGRYDIRPAKAVILMPKVAETLGRANPGARIDCGNDKVRVLDPGQTLRCTVTFGGPPQVVTLRVDDVAGTVSPVAEP